MNILKYIAGYLGSSVLAKGLVLASVPILANILHPSDYGALVLINTIMSILASVIAFALNLNVTRHFHRGEIVKYNVAACVMIMSVIFALVTIAMIVVFGVMQWQPLSFDPGPVIYAIPLIAFSQAIYLFNLNIVRCEERIRKYASLEVGYSFGLLLVAVGAVYVYGRWELYFLGAAAFSLLSLLYAFAELRRFVGNGYFRMFRIEAVRRCLAISAPVFPHVFASLLILYTDRILLDRFFGTQAVAVYAVGYAFGSLLNFYTDAFVKMWGPKFFKLMDATDFAKRLFVARVIVLFVLSALVVLLVLCAFSWIAIQLMFEAGYAAAVEVAVVVAVAYFAHAFYKCFLLFLVNVERTGFVSYSSVIAAMINLAIGLALIPEYGINGAAYASVAAYAISSLLVVIYANRCAPLPWKSVMNFAGFPLRRADLE